jgi:chitin synthase
MWNDAAVSWGNRPTEKSDLGAAKKVQDGKDMIEVEVPTAVQDLDALWEEARAELRVPAKEEHVKRSAEVKAMDCECLPSVTSLRHF